jgi:molybdenum cofactor biosynthesis enzyme MoaA
MSTLLMDGHKLPWHYDRVKAWEKGERIAPIMIDMALTRRCQFNCSFCYSKLQRNEGFTITKEAIDAFLDDCVRMGVRGISFLSDGESTLSPVFAHTIRRGKRLGLSMALGSNCYAYDRILQTATMPYLDYIRINFPAGEQKRYSEITGTKPNAFKVVRQNILDMVNLKKSDKLSVTLGLQMVLMPRDADQIIPFVKLGKELGVDYSVIKHCADDEFGGLGIDYEKYKGLSGLLEVAESYADENYGVQAMWSKMLHGNQRTYRQCYGPPFLIQISGTGLVATCGDKFAPRYERFHLGNICEERWWDIWKSERYWDVMKYLASPAFNAQAMCGPLCRHHKMNEALDAHLWGEKKIVQAPKGSEPMHINFV